MTGVRMYGLLREAPAEAVAYLAAAAERVADILGANLVGVYTTGSLALGDFRLGRSDIDLMAVVKEPVGRKPCLETAERLDHKRLPCPATGLEFVLYPYATVTTATTEAGYLLNLNTGRELPPVVDIDPNDDPAFWFVIDRAITRQSGEALLGPPPQAFFGAPRWEQLLPIVTTAVEVQRTAPDDLLDNVVLNACRALRFAEDRHWYSKLQAARLTASGRGPFTPLLRAAMASHAQGRHAAAQLPADTVRNFLDHVLGVLRHAARH
jgi:hypothetical protein